MCSKFQIYWKIKIVTTLALRVEAYYIMHIRIAPLYSIQVDTIFLCFTSYKLHAYVYTYLILSNFQSFTRFTFQIESHVINGILIVHAIIKSDHLYIKLLSMTSFTAKIWFLTWTSRSSADSTGKFCAVKIDGSNDSIMSIAFTCGNKAITKLQEAIYSYTKLNMHIKKHKWILSLASSLWFVSVYADD